MVKRRQSEIKRAGADTPLIVRDLSSVFQETFQQAASTSGCITPIVAACQRIYNDCCAFLNPENVSA